MQHELALGIDLHAIRALEVEHDALRIRAGCNDEVVFELALVAVVDEVDAGIDLAVVHLRVGRHVGPPLRRIVADEVIRSSGQFLEPAYERRGVGGHDRHAQHYPLHLGPLVLA